MTRKTIVSNIKNENWIDIDWSSVGSVSAPGEKEVIRTVTYEKNPPVIFSQKSSVKHLDVRVTSNKSQDEELLHQLLQKTRQG
ncbi:hypothetical protein D4R99_05590 [bacterium]|nr:MAG: hypothetical protein D4R99_05590 [bacterium]